MEINLFTKNLSPAFRIQLQNLLKRCAIEVAQP